MLLLVSIDGDDIPIPGPGLQQFTRTPRGPCGFFRRWLLGTCKPRCFQYITPGSRQPAVCGQTLTCAIRRSGIRGLDLFLATSSSFALLELGRRQVGQRRVCLGRWFCGRRLSWGQRVGGLSSRGWLRRRVSPRADGSGAGVAVASFSLSFTVLADLMKPSQLSYKSKRAECLLCNQMQTYNVDFFRIAFFTRIARRGALVASGGVTPADGVVPATAMVTVAEDAGSVPTSSCSVLGGEAEGL
jgi:hypothetical protein